MQIQPLGACIEAFGERTAKPWGSEVLLTPSSLPYAGKLLAISAGKRLSLQRHTEKTETVTLVSGSATLLLEDQRGTIREISMVTDVGYTIIARRIHRLVAESDCVVFEASTPERGTTERLDDDFGRKGEHETFPPAAVR